MNNIKLNEINVFINQLRERNIPVIVEYDKNDMPVKLFCKPPQGEWFGIAYIEKKGRIKEKYCILLLSEMFGLVATDKLFINVHGKNLDTLRIEDFDVYVKKAMDEVKRTYNSYKYNHNEAVPEFDLKTDISLKDLLMVIYCRQRKDAGYKCEKLYTEKRKDSVLQELFVPLSQHDRKIESFNFQSQVRDVRSMSEKMDSIEFDEINVFINQLRERNIPVIVEYDKNDMPVKLFCKPPHGEWFGIAYIEEKERIEDEKYCGLLISKKCGIIVTSEFIVKVREKHWTTLRIEDFDVYVKNAMDEVKNAYNLYTYNYYEAVPEFDIQTDIELKDMLMDIYCRQRKTAGRKIVYY